MATRSLCVLLLSVCSLGLVSAANLANVAVYYESMCPDSKRFFIEQLWRTHKQLSQYMTVDLIPYGNAHYTGKAGKYSFTCQHGPEECHGNLMQTCFIAMVNDTSSQIKMINCAFNSLTQKKALDHCMPTPEIRKKVKKCMTSPLGNQLEYDMAKKTEALRPPHSFIPWITINGEGSKDITDKALEAFKSLVCEAIKDQKVDICNEKWAPYNNYRNLYL